MRRRCGAFECRAIVHAKPCEYTVHIKNILDFRLRRDADLLLNSGFFDPEFYASQVDAGEQPTVAHFLMKGWKRGLNPSPFFDSKFYLSTYSDVRESHWNPALHYVRHGSKEGRTPHPDFDVRHYISQYPHVDFSTIDPIQHCIFNYGSLHGFNAYTRDLISAEFNTGFYVSQNPPLNGLDPLLHFIGLGWRNGYDPNPDFSSKYYLRLNPDVKSQNINPFWHFLLVGRAEGRSPKPGNKRRIDASSHLAPILFVGHDGHKTGAEVVLLEIVCWYAEHTRRPLAVLLMEGGALASAYSEYADTYVFRGTDLRNSLDSDEFAAFMDRPFLVSYVNSVASGAFHVIYDRFLKPKQILLILHVHELSSIILEFEDKFKKLKSRATSLIAVSGRVKKCLVDEFNCDERRVFQSNAFIRPVATSVHDIVALRGKARKTLDVEAGDFVIMGCGTVYPRKGPDLFLETAAKIITRGLIPNAKFIWLGAGPNLDTCQSAALDSALDGRVRFVGFRDNANELLAGADVFFLSSREDPFPLVCLEAAQFAVPTLYFEGSTGISEFTGVDAGISVPSYDIDKCCSTLRSLARHPTILEHLGTTARARVLAEHTRDLKCNQIAQHIQSLTNSSPEVTVIVPAYNNALYIEERLESILTQTIQDFEVIVLDDCSTDSTVELAATFTTDSRVQVIRNASNSGSPFKQWKLGLELAKAPIVWIAESDDSSSENFLETLLPAFDDEQVSLAFCSTEIMDGHGSLTPGALDPYYAQGAFPFGEEEVLVDGFTAVELGFGAMNLIVNASSTLMRKSITMNAIDQAATYKMCGDWLIYLHALGNGKLFYSSKAKNYFRRHKKSAVHKLEGTPIYFDERHRIMTFVLENFNVPHGLFQRFLALNENEWHRFRHRNPGLKKGSYLRREELKAAREKRWVIPPMRIGFYVHGMLFSKGGIERLAAELANSLTRRGHSVCIFCRVWGTLKPVYALNESVTLRPIFDENDIENSIPRMRLEVARQNLDCFVPMLSEWLFDPVIEAVESLGVPVLASEHNDPWKIEQLWWSKDKRAACFEKATAIHLLLERFRASLPDHFAPRINVIPNGIRIDQEILSSPVRNRPKRFIGVGRLAPQKRFDRLIKAFSRIRHQIPEWRLDIFGEGGEASKLQKLIDETALNERVTLRGQSRTILKELTYSSVFVLSSEFEGFPIVVTEAKMAGVPSICYANCSGPNELIRDNVDGLLAAPDENGENLAVPMLALAKNEERRIGMASRARENMENFDLEKIVNQWEELLAQISRAQEPWVPAKPTGGV